MLFTAMKCRGGGLSKIKAGYKRRFVQQLMQDICDELLCSTRRIVSFDDRKPTLPRVYKTNQSVKICWIQILCLFAPADVI